MNDQYNNLGIFRILFIIKGIITLCFAFLPVLYFFVGVFIFQRSNIPGQSHGYEIGGAIMMAVGVLVFLFLGILGILCLLTAKYLHEKRHYDFIFVMAIINCLTGVLGILLGVFTILELNKPHVRKLFGK